MKLNLTYISRTERVSARTNKPFTSVSIKAKEYGDKFLSGFGNRDNIDWKEGMEVEVAEVKEVVKDGKTYLNFEMSKKPNLDELIARIGELENRVVDLNLRVIALEPQTVNNTTIDYPKQTPENTPDFDPSEAESLEEIFNQM